MVSAMAEEELKAKDMQGNELSSLSSSDSVPSMTPEQLENLKMQIKVIDENKQKSDALLLELDKEL